MRQLSGGGQGHGLVEEASWGWWPFGGESSVQSSRSNRHDTIAGLRRNNASTGLRTRQDTRITAMVSMVREVLPHVPDELIAQVCYKCLVVLLSVNLTYHLQRVISRWDKEPVSFMYFFKSVIASECTPHHVPLLDAFKK